MPTEPDLQAIEAAAHEYQRPRQWADTVSYIAGATEWSTHAERALAARVLPVLLEVEWGGRHYYAIDYWIRICPVCRAHHANGEHEDGCALAAEIARLRAALGEGGDG